MIIDPQHLSNAETSIKSKGWFHDEDEKVFPGTPSSKYFDELHRELERKLNRQLITHSFSHPDGWILICYDEDQVSKEEIIKELS